MVKLGYTNIVQMQTNRQSTKYVYIYISYQNN